MQRKRMIGSTWLTAMVLHAAFSPSAAAQSTRTFPTTRKVTAPQINAFVAEASTRFDVPKRWIWAVMRIESAGDVTATSSAGAMGLMQIMPQTYASLRATYGFGTNAYDPRDNILAGAAYLRAMHDRYGDTGFLAAYNAGPARYDAFQAALQPLPTETVHYVAQLGRLLEGGDRLSLSLPTMQVPPTPEMAPIFVAMSLPDVLAGGRSGAISLAENALEPSNRTAGLPSRPSSQLAAEVQPTRAGSALFAAIGPRNPS